MVEENENEWDESSISDNNTNEANTVGNAQNQDLILVQDGEVVECKSVSETSPRKLSIDENDSKQCETTTKNVSPILTLEEFRRQQLKKQLNKQRESMEQVMHQLEKLKQKEIDALKDEDSKKPKLTFEMVKQLRTSYMISTDLKSKFDKLDGDFVVKFLELQTKVGNKLDILEFETNLEWLNEKIEKLSKNVGQNVITQRKRSTSKLIKDLPEHRNSVMIPGQSMSDTAIRTLVDRNIAEVMKTIDITNASLDSLKEEYAKQSGDIKLIISNLGSLVKAEQLKMVHKQVILLNDRVDGIVGAPPSMSMKPFYSSPEPEKAQTPTVNRIIINNNSEKLETEKQFRDVERTIKTLRNDTFKHFDYTEDSFVQYKNAISKILERQDQSLLSLLTRITSIEIRVDSLELDDKNFGLSRSVKPDYNNPKNSKQQKGEILEALTIAQKLVEDFQTMRKEIYTKIYEISEGELKNKADLDLVKELEASLKNGLQKLETNQSKSKNEFLQNIKNLSERVSKQSFLNRAASPNPEIDSSAILSKRYDNGSKWANCDKQLGQLDHVKFDTIHWNKMPRRGKKSRMLHMGNGYSKLLQSLEISGDDSFKQTDTNDEASSDQNLKTAR